MKKIVLLFGICLFFFSHAEGAETLTFRFSDPHLYHFSGTNYLVFDIQVKAAANGTYLYSSQVILNANAAGFNTSAVSFIPGTMISGNYMLPIPPFTSGPKYNTSVNWNSGNVNLAIFANNTFNGQSPSGGAYSAVTTVWQSLGTLWLTISNTSSLAGISFKTTSMNGFQKFATGVGPTYSDYYTNPNSYDPSDFSDLNMGRIYSSVSGWTQAGATLDWSAAVNTSVYDTAASAAQLTGPAGNICYAGNLTIHKSGRLILDPDHPLTVTGNTSVQNPRGIWITSTAAGTGSFINTGSVSYANGGSFRVERYIAGSSWHYFDSPVQNAVSGVFTDDFLRSWDEPTYSWNPWIMGTNEPLEVMRGYEVWLAGPSGIRSFTGSVNDGVITRALPYTAAGGGGWNLIGNPYASSQDFGSQASPAAGWTWPADVDRIIYYLTSANGTTYQYNTYSWGTGLGTNGVTKQIPPMQGYFVKVNNAAQVVGCNNSTRIHGTQNFFKSTDDESSIMRLVTSGSQYSDENILLFSENFSSGFDQDYDAYKFANSDSIPSVFSYAADDTPLAIDTRSFTGPSTTVKVGFSAGYSGLFTLTANGTGTFQAGIGIVLEDLRDHVFTDLRVQPAYNFSYLAGEDPGRFIIHFNNPVFGVGSNAGSAMKIYSCDGCVYVNSTEGKLLQGNTEIFDMTGKKVYEDLLLAVPINKYVPHLADGIYVVRVMAEGRIITERIFLD